MRRTAFAYGLAIPLLACVAVAQTPTTRPAPSEGRQIGNMVLEGIPDWDPSLRTRMLQYLQVRRASLMSLSETGDSMLVSTRFGDTAQVHLVRTPMGAREQLTFFDEPVGGAAFVPGTGQRRFVFTKDVGGNENAQIYMMDRDAGDSRLITDGKSRNQSVALARDGSRIAFASNLRNGRDFDIYIANLPDGKPRLVWEVEGSYGPASFSPDGTRLLVQRYVSERETQYFIHDIAQGSQVPITGTHPPIYYGAAEWSADGTAIYVTSDREGEFRRLYRFGVFEGQWVNLTKDIPWDIEDIAVEPTGKGIAFSVNEDGIVRVYFADVNGENRRRVDTLPVGVVSGLRFAHAGRILGLTVDSALAPNDAYTVDFETGRATRWTLSEVGGLNADTFVEPTLIRYPTFDEVDGKPRMIPAFYYKAPQPGPRPVVIYAHGGPEGQTQPNFSSTFQFLVNELGISVLCPNIRGSVGYGRSFHQLDNGVLREDSIRDVGALLDWIEKQPELDKSRIGIYGGSYGGYVVLASLVNYSDRIKAGVNVVGIADFITFLTNTAEYRRDLRRAEYGDERDPNVRTVLEQISPLRNAEKIRSALFVAHGQNDPRVPVSEAHQIVEKMRALGRPAWFANALDEGHGFRKKDNSDLFQVLMMHFWQQHLLN